MAELRWDSDNGEHVERPDVDAFLTAVIEVCKRHQMSIAHEDGHGAFIVTPFSKMNNDWLMDAAVSAKEY